MRTPDDSSYPGKDVGLSRRESAVLALIVQGRTNQEIADECFLSVNSIKTYTAVRIARSGRHRAQAVVWGHAARLRATHRSSLSEGRSHPMW